MARWDIDPVHSTVQWSVRHLGIAAVKGQFTRFSGSFDLNEQKPEASHAEFTIDAGSMDSGNAERDEHISSFDFFDVERYPTISFASEAIIPLGFNAYEVEGTLTIHGQSRPAHLEVTFHGVRPGLQGDRHAGFTVHSHIPLSAFDLNWNVTLPDGNQLVGTKAEVDIELELVEHVAATPASL